MIDGLLSVKLQGVCMYVQYPATSEFYTFNTLLAFFIAV